MEMRRLFLEQLELEAESSRRAIERVPEGMNGWKPHARSMDLGHLAALVAAMPGWIAMMIENDEVDMNAAGATLRTKPVGTRAELVAMLDKGLEESRRALKATTDEHLRKTWTLKMNGQVLTKGPRYTNIRDGALSHLAHHRGQLTVYLRLNEALVPSIYGPSADEFYA